MYSFANLSLVPICGRVKKVLEEMLGIQINSQKEALELGVDWTRRPSSKGALSWDEDMKEMVRKKDVSKYEEPGLFAKNRGGIYKRSLWKLGAGGWLGCAATKTWSRHYIQRFSLRIRLPNSISSKAQAYLNPTSSTTVLQKGEKKNNLCKEALASEGT